MPDKPNLPKSWKEVLGEPGAVTRTVHDQTPPCLYGGGPSFDQVYITPKLDWRFESRNVGRRDGHMARIVVTRNETGLAWRNGWTQGDEDLEALITAAMYEINQPKFALGQLVATPGALIALSRNEQSALEFLERHRTGDWGEVDAEDKRANECSLKDGTRLLSAYHLKDGTKIWLITEADRSATTVLLPEDY